MCEWKTSNQQGCKIDLTYDPEHCPKKYILVKADYQTFIKRLRTDLSRNEPNFNGFKYYIGGEYGPKGGRPHYHIIISGWMPKDMKYWKNSKTGYPMYKSDYITQKWGMGICTVEPINAKTISYVTRYTNKKSGAAAIHKGVPEFQAQSQNIGKKYWEINKRQIIDNLGIWIKKDEKAILCPIPRYYKKMFKKEYPIEYELYLDFMERHNEAIEKARQEHSNMSKIEYLENRTETASILLKQLKRDYLEQAEIKTLDAANNNGYNIHMASGS